MSKNDLVDMTHENVNKLLDKNIEAIFSDFNNMLNSVQSGSNFHESLFAIFLTAIDTGAMAAMQTLIDLKILDISE